jgi:hypothetical protein
MKLMFRISNLRNHPKCVLVLDLIHFFSIKITSKINNVFVWCTKSNNHFAYVLCCATLNWHSLKHARAIVNFVFLSF